MSPTVVCATRSATAAGGEEALAPVCSERSRVRARESIEGSRGGVLLGGAGGVGEERCGSPPHPPSLARAPKG